MLFSPVFGFVFYLTFTLFYWFIIFIFSFAVLFLNFFHFILFYLIQRSLFYFIPFHFLFYFIFACTRITKGTTFTFSTFRVGTAFNCFSFSLYLIDLSMFKENRFLQKYVICLCHTIKDILKNKKKNYKKYLYVK